MSLHYNVTTSEILVIQNIRKMNELPTQKFCWSINGSFEQKFWLGLHLEYIQKCNLNQDSILWAIEGVHKYSSVELERDPIQILLGFQRTISDLLLAFGTCSWLPLCACNRFLFHQSMYWLLSVGIQLGFLHQKKKILIISFLYTSFYFSVVLSPV